MTDKARLLNGELRRMYHGVGIGHEQIVNEKISIIYCYFDNSAFNNIDHIIDSCNRVVENFNRICTYKIAKQKIKHGMLTSAIDGTYTKIPVIIIDL